MTDSVAAQFDRLAGMLKHDLNHDLDFNAKEIRQLLDQEISSRYFDDATMIRRSLRDDPDTAAAAAVLSDPKRYQELLAPSAKQK